MDPDYELPETIREQANKRREKERLEQIETAKVQINEDFQKEFDQREHQLIDIQNRITCLAKTLHVLRYVLVSNYYNKQEAQLQIPEEELKLVDEQQRLHPAVKKLISERDLATLDFTKRNTRRTSIPGYVMPEQSVLTNEETPPPASKQGTSGKKEMTAKCYETNIPRNRQMTKRRLIVGNISKWMPSDNPEDKSTHKWMVYIRGPPDNPNIDDIVEKIVFHLHPSYHPHDVIEIKDTPFHLTRRGWGEFPIRCQLHFKGPLNKPVDVIHYLRLDKTFSGRQTLGSETVVELTLYDEITEDEPEPVELQILEQDEDLATLIDSMDFSSTVVPKINNEVVVTNDDATLQLNDDFNQSIVLTTDGYVTDYDEYAEEVEVMETSLEQGNDEHNYCYDVCPALSDHTYSLGSVRSC